MEKLEWCG